MTEEFDQIMNQQLSEKLNEAGYVASQTNIDEELLDEEFDTGLDEELPYEEDTIDSEIVVQGKRTCMVKQKFKEALANIRYIHYNSHFDQKMRELDQRLSATKESLRIEKVQANASDKMFEQQQEVQYLKDVVATEQANLEKLSQQTLTEDQITMMQNIAAEHQRDLKKAERKLEKNNDIKVIQMYQKQIERLEKLKEKRTNKWVKINTDLNVDINLKNKLQERVQVKEEEQQYVATNSDLDKMIQKTEEDKSSYNDEYWETANQLTQEALKTGDVTALERLNAEKASKDKAVGEVLQNLDIRKQTVSTLLEEVSKKKKTLRLQTSLPYVVAKGFASVVAASVQGIKESIQNKRIKEETFESQEVPVTMEEFQTTVSEGPQLYDEEDIEYRKSIYENVNAILDSSLGDDIGRLQFANLLESYRRMYNTEEETKDKEKQK